MDSERLATAMAVAMKNKRPCLTKRICSLLFIRFVHDHTISATVFPFP